ncbi:hypothetical protein G6F65_015110 [Rhizopus arrhizus]|nr:hypothetical protein G6F65_015110 [Rhizopus arrhizus]
MRLPGPSRPVTAGIRLGLDDAGNAQRAGAELEVITGLQPQPLQQARIGIGLALGWHAGVGDQRTAGRGPHPQRATQRVTCLHRLDAGHLAGLAVEQHAAEAGDAGVGQSAPLRFFGEGLRRVVAPGDAEVTAEHFRRTAGQGQVDPVHQGADRGHHRHAQHQGREHAGSCCRSALDRQQAAVIDAVDVLAALGQPQVVGDQHQRGAAAGVEFEQQVADVLAGGVVQRAGRFVGEQDARAGDEGTCQGHALLLAARQLARVVTGAMAQADLRQHFVHPHPVFAAGQLQRQRDVLGGGQRRQQVEALEHEADLACAQLGAGFLVETAQILAGQRNAAAAGQVQPGQQAEQGGLAGTGGADDGHAGAFMDGQGDVVQRDGAGEPAR